MLEGKSKIRHPCLVVIAMRLVQSAGLERFPVGVLQ